MPKDAERCLVGFSDVSRYLISMEVQKYLGASENPTRHLPSSLSKRKGEFLSELHMEEGIFLPLMRVDHLALVKG